LTIANTVEIEMFSNYSLVEKVSSIKIHYPGF